MAVNTLQGISCIASNTNVFYIVTGAVSYSYARFGQGHGAIFLDNVCCVGSESELLNCSHGGIGIINSYCYQSSGVAVECPSGERPSIYRSADNMNNYVCYIDTCIYDSTL